MFLTKSWNYSISWFQSCYHARNFQQEICFGLQYIGIEGSLGDNTGGWNSKTTMFDGKSNLFPLDIRDFGVDYAFKDILK